MKGLMVSRRLCGSDFCLIDVKSIHGHTSRSASHDSAAIGGGGANYDYDDDDDDGEDVNGDEHGKYDDNVDDDDNDDGDDNDDHDADNNERKRQRL